ncbi:MAG: sugar ABC transporter permease [Clostridia bacterium]|nr:sugar ABC transporter permease [Clostridia bacterium]
MRKVQTATKQNEKKTGFIKNIRNNWQFLLMAMPGFVQVLLFSYLPMAGLILAFKSIDYSKSIFEMDWVGFKNFEFLFKNPDVFTVLRNTILYNLVFIIAGATVPVAIAIGLSLLRNKRMAKVYHGVGFLPYFISWVIISYLAVALFDYRLGILNNMGMEPVNWYQTPKYWPFILVFFHIWKSCGYNAVIYYAAIKGIDSELYEAAAIDGAGVGRQIWVITVPSLKPTIIMMAILAVGKILNADFGLFYNVPMGSGALLPVTNVLDVFTYNALKLNGDIAMSSASGFFQSIVGFCLVLITNYIVRRIDESQALF